MTHDIIRARYTEGAFDQGQARRQLEADGCTRLEAQRIVDSWTDQDEPRAVA